MPYRSHVQHVLPELTLEGDELLVDLDVSDGTLEESSESYSSESSSSSSSSEILVVELAGETVWRANCDVRAAMVALSYCVLMTCRVWWGRSGFGAIILDGESARPLGMEAALDRRWCRFAEDDDCCVDDAAAAADGLVFPGMSRMFSLRPVVGSVVWSLAGSCET